MIYTNPDYEDKTVTKPFRVNKHTMGFSFKEIDIFPPWEKFVSVGLVVAAGVLFLLSVSFVSL